ncbi:RDD family protein [Flavobacterium luminosum]|uniref:RDD family protein n=1 Tax=Flavobacterium luminosum TaxID=2949086 RepID=A0ABT0TLZ2_9FLAO|nr:RDD family protein [Flavobacterium sp. HXWNR70]MCL9808506.1 RDD family protein [Flavobacterium sp. HXWNR70]
MSELTINTTQNVNINFRAASLGDRMLAGFIDLLVKVAYVLIVLYVFFDLLGLSNYMDKTDTWSGMAIVIMLFFPVFVYSLVLEAIFEGQTIGKKLLKIKVVKLDGYQAGFGDYLIRWIFRIIEGNGFLALVGIIAMATSKKVQRLGDMAAGTAVIALKNSITINNTILEEIGNEYVPTYPLVIKLSDNDMRIIKETFNNALAQDDFELINKLKEKIETVTGIRKQSESNREFIRTILKDYNYYTQNM